MTEVDAGSHFLARLSRSGSTGGGMQEPGKIKLYTIFHLTFADHFLNTVLGHVFKGKKMPGRMGSENVCVQNLKVWPSFTFSTMMF